MGPSQGRTSVTRWSLFGHSRPLISSDKPPNLSIDSNHRQHTTQAVIVCPLQECVLEEWRAWEAAYPMCLPATPRILDPANLFCNTQCTSVRLYHRSWFAGRKTYARHVSRWVTPASLRDKDRECHTDLGAPSALHRFQAHRLRRLPPVWFAYQDFGWPVLLLPLSCIG